MLAGRNVAGQNESVRWTDDLDRLRKLVAFRHLLNLRIAYAEIAQTIGITLKTAHALLIHSARIGHGAGAVLTHGTGDARGGSQQPGGYSWVLAHIRGGRLLVHFHQYTDRLVA